MAGEPTKETTYSYGKLRPHEIFWRDNSSFLLAKGYQLRPRFRPGWVPSWLGKDKPPVYFEDSRALRHPKTIDALRLHDNRDVFIKRVEKGSAEVDINVYLSSPSLRADASNHAAPLLELIVGDDEYDFVVMPVLRYFNDPPFVSVDEVLDFVQQSLEGLVFLHRAGVAHRDCSDLNVMLDASSMYPDGFHPYRHHTKRSGSGIVRDHLNRADVLSSIRYYFTDFGISSWFKDPAQPRTVTGRHCQDKSVPELSDDEPYDPFKTDVYILGNVYKRHLTDIYSNLSFLNPLVYEMTKMSPQARPSAEDALAYFHNTVRQQRRIFLRWMLVETDLTRSKRVGRHLHSLSREIRRSAKKVVGLPANAVVFAVLTIVSLVYGPRNIISRIRDFFPRSR